MLISGMAHPMEYKPSLKRINPMDAHLAHGILMETGQQIYRQFRLDFWAPAPSVASIKRQAEKKIVCLIEIGGELAGTLTMGDHGWVSGSERFWQDDHGLYVSRFALLPCFQGYGIGSQVMLQIEKMAVKSNFTSIRLEVHEQFQPSIHFYMNLNYQFVGECDRVNRFGKEYRLVLFEKLLNAGKQED